jgi:hypothetical protein
MSGFIPGLAAPGVPLYEADTDIQLGVVSPDNLTFPDVIPEDSFLGYSFVPVSQDPVNYQTNSYLVSCNIGIIASNIGNSLSALILHLGQSVNLAPSDPVGNIPLKPYVDTFGNQLFIINFSSLVKVLPGNRPKLFVGKDSSNADTTVYTLQDIRVSFKRL